MGLPVIKETLTKKDLDKAREDYKFYIKITVDIRQKIVVLGGTYHADAEKLLLDKYNSVNKNIWGGGFNLKTKKFETNAIINIKPRINESMEIIDEKLRRAFLKLIRSKMKGIEKLV